MRSARILIVEDERIVALDMRRRLEDLGYVVVAAVASGAAALLEAQRNGPDLALVDINIEGPMDGIETARQLREQHGVASLFLTAYGDDSILQRAIGSLPLGYLIKPVHMRDLHAALQTALARRDLERALVRYGQQREHQAQHDMLTGLPNRLLFEERLGHALAWATLHRSGCAVLFLDLDGFKEVNDARGHAEGDLLLRAIAGRLRACLRRSDTVARLGGDEFVVLMERLRDVPVMLRMANNLLAAISAPVPLSGGGEAWVSASIGISRYPEDGEDPASLLRAADQAMYAAKHRGGNRAVLHGEESAAAGS